MLEGGKGGEDAREILSQEGKESKEAKENVSG